MPASIDLPKKVIRLFSEACKKYQLIQEGDHILLGLSGGKDSTTLAHLLKYIQKKAPFHFSFTAVIITYGMGENYTLQKKHCEEYGINCEIFETSTFDLAKEKINKNSSFCSFFSRMRRGALSNAAEKLGCNKIALGHHLDDAAESLFMNIMYNGTLRSLPPKYTAKNGKEIIRPMCLIREKDLKEIAEKNHFPTVGDEMCPAFRMDIKMPYARANTKKLLIETEKEIPQMFDSIRSALGNIHERSLY